jgi:hypothetical protein
MVNGVNKRGKKYEDNRCMRSEIDGRDWERRAIGNLAFAANKSFW